MAMGRAYGRLKRHIVRITQKDMALTRHHWLSRMAHYIIVKRAAHEEH